MQSAAKSGLVVFGAADAQPGKLSYSALRKLYSN